MSEKITVVGIDLAKSVFHLHGANEKGGCLVKKKVSRKKLAEVVTQLPRCLVAMEACSGSHYWARKFKGMGHDVKLISPQYVRPYVKTNKNDYVDAEAIAEAATRPHMRFVSVKGVEHHDIQTLHRIRQRVVRARVALTNEIRGLLQEYGVVLPQGMAQLKKELPRILGDEANELTTRSRRLFQDLLEELGALSEKIEKYDREIKEISRNNETCQRLEAIEGVGPVTSTAVVASVPDPRVFKNGRSFSAWLGLVPRHSGTGGKIRLGKMSKRGDSYLRTLLVHGARSALLLRHDTKRTRWAKQLLQRKGANKAAVALANKNARVIWALMAKGEKYQREYRQVA